MADWNAAAYDRVSDPQFAWGVEVLDRLALRGDETVLDAGCGSGRLTALLQKRLPHGRLVALDASAGMTRQAHSSLPGRVDVVHADLTSLPFRGAFDVIVSTAVFHWIHDQDALFAQLHRALRPQGRLHAQCGGGPNLRVLHEEADQVAREARFAPWFKDWSEPWLFQTPEVAQRRLVAAGFRSPRTWLEPKPTEFRDRQAYAEFLETVVLRNHLARLPAQLRGDYLEAVVSLGAASDRSIAPHALDYWRLNLTAVA